MFYEVYWNTPVFADMWTQGVGSQPFVLSNGDKTGYSLHADFISGWDVETLQQIIDNCDAGDSGMDKCPGLIGGINDASTSCNIPEAINENIHGVLDALPGNNPVTGWGVSGSPPVVSSVVSSVSRPSLGSPTGSSASSATSAIGGGYGYSSSSIALTSSVKSSTSVPSAGQISPSSYLSPSYTPVSYPTSAASLTLTSSPLPVLASIKATTTSHNALPTGTATNPTISGWSYTGCYTDKLNPRAIGTSGIQYAYLGQHNVTTTSCVEYCDKAGYSIAGTEYAGQCFCDNSILSYSNVIDQSQCHMPCEGLGGSGQLCGGSLALSVYTRNGVSARGHHHFGRTGFHKRLARGL